jgi:hypothetical protein
MHEELEIKTTAIPFAVFKDPPFTAPLPPSDTNFTTAISLQAVTQKEFNDLMANDGIILHAKIVYRDTYRNRYETGICLIHLANDALLSCDGNYMK